MKSCSIATLHERLAYDAETGVLTWRATGSVAGYVQRDGYRAVKIDGVAYPAHRMVWAMVYDRWPEGEIDHIDLARDNNRLLNLRPATRQQNSCNRRRPFTSYLPKGVSRYNNRKRPWRAVITVNRQQHFIGAFATVAEAHAAYSAAAERLHGEFARAA